jgi:hypothetical protein
MPPEEFEPATLASKRPQTDALGRAAIVIVPILCPLLFYSYPQQGKKQ